MTKENISLAEVQQQVDNWIKTTGVRYFSELTNMAVLTEEVGELARIMARKFGDQSFKESDKIMILPMKWQIFSGCLLRLQTKPGVDLTKLSGKFWKRKTPAIGSATERTVIAQIAMLKTVVKIS